MLLVPLVALNAVPDRVPAADAAGTARSNSGDEDRSTRLAMVSAAAERASRSLEAPTDTAPAVTEPPTTVPPSTAPPATVPPTTAVTVRSAAIRDTTTTAKPRPTTTTAAPTTTTTQPPPPPNRQEGEASFYNSPSAEICAHRTLKFGTVLRVTNLANGKHTTCTVKDRGPYIAGRIVDLSEEAFTRIAPRSAGVARVSIEW